MLCTATKPIFFSLCYENTTSSFHPSRTPKGAKGEPSHPTVFTYLEND